MNWPFWLGALGALVWYSNKHPEERIQHLITGVGDIGRISSVQVRSLNDKINLISKLIAEGEQDPVVLRLRSQIIQDVKPRDYKGEVTSIFDWVQDNIRYTHDVYDKDTFQRARRTLELNTGDCDDMTILLGSLLRATGYPVRAKVVSVHGHEWDHIYLQVGVPPLDPKKWVPLDATVDRPVGWEVDSNQVEKIRIFDL